MPETDIAPTETIPLTFEKVKIFRGPSSLSPNIIESLSLTMEFKKKYRLVGNRRTRKWNKRHSFPRNCRCSERNIEVINLKSESGGSKRIIEEPEIINIEEPEIINIEEPEVINVEEPEPEVINVEEPEVINVEGPEVVGVEEPKVVNVEEPRVVSVEEPEVVNIEEPRVVSVEEPEVENIEIEPEPDIEIIGVRIPNVICGSGTHRQQSKIKQAFN